ncbi:hypothetical protein [Blattabacterium cuenoti]|uniref:hypothetical protein n=1 Tax=Blattabacterium cuenoti TaxID=1653831 RepID=UPI00163CE42E|nr:hypothetical protein [Blattabacterium cuenoti]
MNKLNKKNIFSRILKNGKFFFNYPIILFFEIKKIKCKENSSVKLIGFLVKKKFLKNQFIGIG